MSLTGDDIKRARLEAGLSQANLAAAMNALGFKWRQTTVAKQEADRRPLLAVEAQALCRLLPSLNWPVVSQDIDLANIVIQVAKLNREVAVLNEMLHRP